MFPVQNKKIVIIALLVLFFLGIYGLGQKKSEDSSMMKGSFMDSSGMMGSGANSGFSASIFGNDVEPETNRVTEAMPRVISDGGMQKNSVGETSSDGIVDKKIIKNASLSVNVKEAEEAVKNIQNVVTNLGGELFGTVIAGTKKDQRSGTITVKVPIENFEKALEEIKKIVTAVEHENISGKDVTEEYTDLASRLRNKKAEELSFLTILEKAIKIDDVLLVTKELSRTRGEIEILEGRLRLLDNQITLSTITINFTEDTRITLKDNNWRPQEIFKTAIDSLISDVQDLASSIIIFFVRSVPILLLYGLGALVLFLIVKKIIAINKKK